MEKFVMAAGAAVRYSDFGQGQNTICLLHGYLESIEVWSHFGGLLGKQFRIIEIDLPGHGISTWAGRESITVEFMAEVVSEVLRKAGVEQCTLVGHSMGGYVVAAMAELHPEQLSSIVFFHSSPSGDTPEKIQFRQREIEAIAGGKKELLATINPGRGFAPHNLKRCENAIDELSEQVMMTEDVAIIATLKGLMERTDRIAIVAALDIPVLYIFGKFDNYIPLESALSIIKRCPKAVAVWLENSGHNGFIEEPQLSAEIITDFAISGRYLAGAEK